MLDLLSASSTTNDDYVELYWRKENNPALNLNDASEMETRVKGL